MRLAIAARITIRISGVLLIGLGLLFWTGNADQLIPVHEVLGFVLVIALWTLAFLAARAGVSIGLVALAVVWGLVAPFNGLGQRELLTGSWHWLIQVIHLLIGLGAVGLGEMLARAIGAREAGARLVRTT